MLEVLDAAVSWMHPYMNNPGLAFRVDSYPRHEGARWREFKIEPRGELLISRQAPFVRFFYHDPLSESGALGGLVTMENGDESYYKGGWSSNEGAVNRLRLTDEAIAEFLPHPLVDVTIYCDDNPRGTIGWDYVGMAGMYFDLPWVEEQVKNHLPEISLFNVVAASDLQGSAEQSQAIMAGFSLKDRDKGTFFLPYPTDTPGIKAPRGSDLYNKTETQIKQADARSARISRP